MVPKPTKPIVMHLGQWVFLQLFLKLLHSPDLDVGWKERESGRPCVEEGEEQLWVTFSTRDTALLELVAFLRCKLSRTEFLSVPLGHYQTWGWGDLGVRVCLSSWVQFSVNHKGSRAEKLIVRIKDSCWAHKNSLQHKFFQWSSRAREVLLEGPHGHASSFLGFLWPPDALLQGEARALAQSQHQPPPLRLCVVLLHAFLFLSFLTFSRNTTPTIFHCAKPPWTYNPCEDVALVSVVFNTFHFESWAIWTGEETIEDLFSLLMYKLNSSEPWRSSKVLRAAPILPLLYVQPPHGVSKETGKPPGAQGACRKHCSVGTYCRKKKKNFLKVIGIFI